MKIKCMRLVLPARMSSSVQVDARMIAEAAARALQGSKQIKGLITVQVQGYGRPAKFISQRVFQETTIQARKLKGEG